METIGNPKTIADMNARGVRKHTYEQMKEYRKNNSKKACANVAAK